MTRRIERLREEAMSARRHVREELATLRPDTEMVQRYADCALAYDLAADHLTALAEALENEEADRA